MITIQKWNIGAGILSDAILLLVHVIAVHVLRVCSNNNTYQARTSTMQFVCLMVFQ